MHTLQIRNSTTEFLIFTSQVADGSIEVRVDEGTFWLSQKQMAQLFDVNVHTGTEHLQNSFKAIELVEDSVIRNYRITPIFFDNSVCRKFRHTANDGSAKP
jgi:hypothetical protein